MWVKFPSLWFPRIGPNQNNNHSTHKGIAMQTKTSSWLAACRPLFAIGGVVAAVLAAAPAANAVPAYARQTGQDCIACHVGGFGPQLTAFGRAFKMSAFTLGSNEGNVPLSAMLVASYTHTATDQVPAAPRLKANDNFSALQQASIFLAGKLSDHVGVFGQATYSDTTSPAHIGWDNTELRYAHDYQVGGVDGIFGLSLNNNPTLSDVWNTVPAWQFSYMGPPFGSSGPSATPTIYGLGASVAGLTAYTQVAGHWYVEAGAYHNLDGHTAQLLNAGQAGLVGMAPYARAWYSTNIGPHVLELGLIGMTGQLNPAANPSPTPTDRFTDTGIDATYQFVNGGDHLVTANFIDMRERTRLDQTYGGLNPNAGADNAGNLLNNASMNVSYWYQNTYGATVGLFNSVGSYDAQYFGGSPNTTGSIFELDWNPFGKSWTNPEKNLRIGLQYSAYSQFNGVTANASDNNTLYLYLWTAI